jgi:predicted HTH transcriptional regulator
LAADVAAFANTTGGTLVVGADERSPERGGLAHPGVVADHARRWIETHVDPIPEFDVEEVTLEPGRTFVVVSVQAGRARPYIAEGHALERRGDRLIPISPDRIREVGTPTGGNHASPDLPAAIAVLAETVERLERRAHWKRQLPTQMLLLVAGAIAGYLLGVWNPLG